MLPVIRRRVNYWIHNWNILLTRNYSKRQYPEELSILYQTCSEDQLLAKVSPGTVIPFQNLPLSFFKPFSTSSCKLTSSRDAGSNYPDELLDELDNMAYKLLFVTLSDEDLTELSALYMQATNGPCDEPEPTEPMCLGKGKECGFQELDYWKRWKSLGKMSKEEAVKNYLKIAKKYVDKL